MTIRERVEVPAVHYRTGSALEFFVSAQPEEIVPGDPVRITGQGIVCTFTPETEETCGPAGLDPAATVWISALPAFDPDPDEGPPYSAITGVLSDSSGAEVGVGTALATTYGTLLGGEVRFQFLGGPRDPNRPRSPYMRFEVQTPDGAGFGDAYVDLDWWTPTFVALPDTLAPGAEAVLALSSDALAPETPVLLTLSDDAPGALAGLCAPPPTRHGTQAAQTEAAAARTAVQTTVGAFADCRFVAGDAAGSAALTADVNGLTLSATVTVEAAALTLRLLRQNDVPVPLPASGGYLMVSKVRPDWLLPSGTLPFDAPFGADPFRNTLAAAPPSATYHDPDTWRLEATGFPTQEAAEAVADRLRFRVEVLRGEAVVFDTEDGARRGDAQRDDAGQTRLASGAVGLDPETNTFSIRAGGFNRLVSNDRPQSGGASYTYDDDVRGDETILVRLRDEVRVSGRIEGEGGAPATPVGQITYTVGDAPTSSGIDAVRRVDLAWQTYERADGTRLGSVPARTTERVSEDWAQASIYFEAISDDVFASSSVTNALQVVVTGTPPPGGGAPQTTASGTIRVSVGGQVVPFTYSAGASGGDIASLLAVALRPATGVTTVGVSNSFKSNKSFGLVVAGRYGQSVTLQGVGNSAEVELLPGLPDLDAIRAGSRVADAVMLAVKDEDPGSIDVLTVPEPMIEFGTFPDNPSLVAFARSDRPSAVEFGTANTAVLPAYVSDGDDRRNPTTAGHEIGHVLLGPVLAREQGEPASAEPEHSALTYNIMYRSTVEGGGDGPNDRKRITPAMHEATRCESGSSADGIPATLCASLGVDYDRTLPALLRVPTSTSLADSGSDR